MSAQSSKSKAHFGRMRAWFLRFSFMLPICCGAANGPLPEYTSQLWQIEDGLPHTIVQTLVQTHDGYIWVGTREGVVRFDGVRFTPFPLPGKGPQPSITCISESRDQSLWIATEDA